jgi:hypothetical protein
MGLQTAIFNRETGSYDQITLFLEGGAVRSAVRFFSLKENMPNWAQIPGIINPTKYIIGGAEMEL